MKKLILIMFLCLAARAEAATYWVSPSGNNASCATIAASGPTTTVAKTTINAGRACLAAGDTLNIRAGTYSERISEFDFSFPRASSWATATIIQAYNSEQVIISPPSGTFHGSPSYIFPAFGIVGGSNTAPYYLIVRGPGLIIDCGGTYPNGLNARCADAFKVDSDTDVNMRIRFNNIEARYYGWDGILGCGGCEIQSVHFHHGTTGTPAENSSNCPGNGCLAGGHGLYIGGSNNLMEDNEFDNHAGYGIQIQYTTTGNIVRRNRTHHNGSGGIVLSGQATAGQSVSTSLNQVYNNLVWSNGAWGIQIGGGGSQTVNNNTVVNNTIWNNAANGGAGIRLVSGTGNVVRNNLNWGNAADFLGDVTGNTVSNNLCNSVGTACQFSGPPGFTNAAGADFTINSSSSPASNNGLNLTALGITTDYANNARPASAAWDIGAYEIGGVPPPVGQLVLALPLDDGSGTTAQDVSGQKNNASLGGGATWDNAGKYGKAIMFDGSGYLTVPAVQSLALAPAMTLEAWIYPTVAFTGFAAVMVQNYQYYLYAATDPGYCPAPSAAPIGGYNSSGANIICATSVPAPNEWSHLAVTYDGAMMTFYLNGNVIASQASGNPMVQASNYMTVGASMFGEYFTGKIDEPRVYNYARTPAQIVSDMNTPLIGLPGKVVEIAAPVSVEISSASSIEISAD